VKTFEIKGLAINEEYINLLQRFAGTLLVAQCKHYGIHVIPKPDQIIFNPPATIVNWDDGTKTVVKTHDEPFDKEKGLAMAFMRKIYGSRNAFLKELSNAHDQSESEE